MYTEDDNDYSNYADFDKPYLDHDKSVNNVEAAIFRKNKKISTIYDYEM